MFSDARAELHEFVAKRFPDGLLDDDRDIFESGFVNSLFAMELVMFIEQNLGDRIPNDELMLDNFRTVDVMTELVGRLSARNGRSTEVA
ncbi:phosphopantetheine binding protein [Nocardia tenerifensis]|uniref:Phosphopantetheine binding protein n=1 Tax=Nocardia tenerifensis TaxID=228006 RepID=A0A318KZE6_9NOCA|nr:phosphopantetheine-binding protein [Nocardia tenerifensis]PXX71234.1 phosphopantetheine binding protein [Nocardia tenerifensis]